MCGGSSCSTARAWAGEVVARVARMVMVVPVGASTSIAAAVSRSRVTADAFVMLAAHTFPSAGRGRKATRPMLVSLTEGCGMT